MKTINNIAALIFLVMVMSCKAQDTIQPTNNVDSVQTWYAYNMEGELGSCTFQADKIIFKSPVDSKNEKDISEVIIEKHLGDQYLLVRNNAKKPPYAVLSLRIANGNILKMAPVTKGTSVLEAEEQFKNKTIPEWISLTERDWYSRETIEKLEKAPGLDKLTREDLLTALQWREPLAEKLQKYLEDTGGNRRFMIYRFVETYRNQKLVELGYNPYKRVTYNLARQFKSDEEILKLLNEEIRF
jgi:hypothetical protein